MPHAFARAELKCGSLYIEETARIARAASSFECLLLGVESAAERLIASAVAGVLPFHLDQPVVAVSECLIIGPVANRAGGWTKLPRTLVCILLTARIIPGVEIR